VSEMMSPADELDRLWVRVGGGLEELPGGRRHGPADPDFAPPDGPWEELRVNGRLVGWAPPGRNGRAAARRAEEEGQRLARERQARLLRRLGHKLRSSILALQESSRQAAFGQRGLLEEIYDQAQDVGRRALAMEAVALDPKDSARNVVLGAVLTVAAQGADFSLPGDAVVRVPEPVLVEALGRAYEWMGGAGATFGGERVGNWWRLDLHAAPAREPLPVPELGEPLVRLLVDSQLDGWLDVTRPESPAIYLPAA
jgi:hypothetical protein